MLNLTSNDEHNSQQAHHLPVNYLTVPTRTTFSLLAIRTLTYWLALGLALQIGLVFWPIGNYATTVYLGFYLPFLLLLMVDCSGFQRLVVESDSVLLFNLLILLCWVVISTLWSIEQETNLSITLDTLKYSILILTYTLGIAYLAKFRPQLILAALYLSIILAAIISTLTVVNLYVLEERGLTTRIFKVGIKQWAKLDNAVVVGIYFGGLTTIAAALSVQKLPRTTLEWAETALLALSSLCCFSLTLFSWTRTAFVSLWATVLVYLLATKKIKTAVTFATTTGMVFAFAVFNSSNFLNKLINRGGLGSWRPELWYATWQASLGHFWLGSGAGSESVIIATRGKSEIVESHGHNFYLQFLYWTGVIGLSMYLCMLGRVFLDAHRVRKSRLGTMCFVLLAYFGTAQLFDIYNIFNGPSYYWACIWLPIGITLGLTAHQSGLKSRA